MTKSRWIIFGAICAIILGALVFMAKQQNSDTFSGDPFALVTSGVYADNITGGTSDHKVVLMEYGDFQCPGCEGMYPTVEQLRAKYKDDVTYVFRNFPITTLHPNALAAATAAESAAQQGKFFDMYNTLYQKQDEWKDSSADQRETIFEGYAKDLSLNVDQFKKDLTSDNVTKKLNRDRATAQKAGVNSTPTFFLNGKLVDQTTWSDNAKFEKAIQDAITQATGKKFS